jgi:MtfA peptidase
MLKTFFKRLTGTATVSIPQDLWAEAVRQLPFLARLDDDELAELRAMTGELLGIKEMAGAGDLELNAAMQVNIALQACLPVLNLGLDWYRGWSSIVVYPDEFLVPRSVTDEAGVVHEYVEPISGEAWERGPLVLSWADAQRSVTAGGAAYAVVIHEFVHKIDLLDGQADGVPPFSSDLHPNLTRSRWDSVLDDAFNRFNAELELIESELPSGIDPDDDEADRYYARLPIDTYAAQDPAEFFAVSSEAFFVEPARLRQVFPDWYALLGEFFRQDPLSRRR